MHHPRGPVIVVLCALPSLPLGAAEISGNLFYDNLPVAEVFSDITATQAYATPWDAGDQLDGTVDLGSSTYSICFLTAGAGRVGAYLSVVDNATGDPTYVAIAPQLPAGG